MLDAISSQDGGLPEIEMGEILAYLIQIADDDRGQAVWIEIPGGNLCDLVWCNGFDTRDELGIVIVRQVEQRDLGDRTSNLIKRLEVSRVSPRQGGNAHRQFFD